MINKRKITYIFFILFFSLFSQAIFSKNLNLAFDFSLDIPGKTDLKSDKVAYVSGLEFNWKNFDCSLFSRIDNPKYDISFHSQYLFDLFPKHNLGVFSKYHFYLYKNKFSENDLVFGLFYDLKITEKSKFLFFLGDLVKYTKFTNLNFNKFQNTLYMKLFFNYVPTEKLSFQTEIQTCDTFEFLTFISLFIKTGATYHFSENISASLNLDFKLLDPFTVATHLTSFKIIPSIRISL